MPDSHRLNNLTAELPITVLASNAYQINGGTAIAGGTISAEASSFSDTVTVTGVRATDKRLAIKPRDAVVIPDGLSLVSITCSANDTIVITWRNTTLAAITPPASGVWSLAILGNFIRG